MAVTDRNSAKGWPRDVRRGGRKDVTEITCRGNFRVKTMGGAMWGWTGVFGHDFQVLHSLLAVRSNFLRKGLWERKEISFALFVFCSRCVCIRQKEPVSGNDLVAAGELWKQLMVMNRIQKNVDEVFQFSFVNSG
ncbi:hypothetical protein TNIN_259501 [Trichonephila inaurata madagascariensis]|uniref:Uncharacterized protein n=1 Tax=Trichonephila inaurata madagascariensis TaxID=2747483 RepID=A0A8X6Y7C1_9ARAC|nr:hypothetical protein TNIN_259501 [Trichonephila inaurata madagascariensis]